MPRVLHHVSKILLNGNIPQPYNICQVHCSYSKSIFNFKTYKDVFKINKKYFHARGNKGSDVNIVPSNGNMGISGSFSSNIVKPLCFTVVFCGSTFVGCSIWQYENLRQKFKSSKVFPQWKYGEFRRHVNAYWNSLTEGEKIFWPICFLNALVFCAWRITPLQSTMFKYFAFNPASKHICLPMVLSLFSHFSAIHLGFNMFALHSFCSSTCRHLGKEQFLALYLSAGVVGNFFSHFVKVMRRTPGYSLGASGAILGVVGYLCCTVPDARLSLIFLPYVSFSAGHAIMGIIAFDTIGLLLRKSFLDHAAHLGGTLSGIFYCYFGHNYLWRKREGIIKIWHEIRHKFN